MPSPDLSNLLSCNYGTSAFAVESYQFASRDVVKQGQGRTGIEMSVTCKGYLQGSDPSDLSAKVAAFMLDAALDGRDLIVTGINQAQEVVLLAAWCEDGGPHVSCQLGTDGPVPNTRGITLTAAASVIPPDNRDPTQPTDTYSTTIDTKPDGLHTITRKGELHGSNVTGYFVDTLLPTLRDQYAPDTFVIDVSYDTQTDSPRTTKLTYTITARETFGPLPDFGEIKAVDGTASERVDRDEQMRQTTVLDFDLLIVGDASAALSMVRRQVVADGSIVLRESATTESIKENRLRASFTILDSASGDEQMNYTQGLRVQCQDSVYEEITYVGADPIYVLKPRQAARVTQSGSAIAAGVWRKAPDKLWPLLSAPREITLNDQNEVEKQTAWTYSMFLIDGRGSSLSPDQLKPANVLPREKSPPDFYPDAPPPPQRR